MMKINIASTSRFGGAGIAARRLRDGLDRLEGIEARFLHRTKTGNAKISELFRTYTTRVRKFSAANFRLDRKSAGSEKFTTPIASQIPGEQDQLLDCDILNLHWVADFLDLPSLTKKANSFPKTFWTLHDMNPFTGGCHYDQHCGKYVEECGSCPQLVRPRKNDSSYSGLATKARFCGALQDKLEFIAPSKWLTELCRQSRIGKNHVVHHIPNGIDVEVFAPKNTEDCRKELGLAPDTPVLLFAADGINNRRKGFQILIDALSSLRAQSQLLVVGKGDVKIPASSHHLGEIKDENTMSMAYAAADIFVIPSLQDNLPNTILESLACGTPVVGFNIGGIGEMVRPGVSGWLAQETTPEALCLSLEEAIAECNRENPYRSSSRKLAVEEFSREVQAINYARLFHSSVAGA